MKAFLNASETIDCDHPAIIELAQILAAGHSHPTPIAQACFEWVRDRILHSSDFQQNPVTCRASDVLKYQTGYCYAKSHLLAALLRANGIPAGLCYQRLKLDEAGTTYCLHGLNAIYLPDWGWYRVDPRGNRDGIHAQFTLPQEQLAFQPHLLGEIDFPYIFPEPLSCVVATLTVDRSWDDVLRQLPDRTPESLQPPDLFGAIVHQW